MALKQDPLSACAAGFARIAGTLAELIAPGRQAGFHVDRIVMRARRAVDLLNETPPNTAGASEQTGLIDVDLAAGMASLSFSGMFGTKYARAVAKPGVTQRSVDTVMHLSNDLAYLLRQSPGDLPAARSTAAALLGAAEDLRTSAYAFEDGRRARADDEDAKT